MSEFQSVRAVVTGAASGIGAATSALLLREGGRVVGLDRTPNGQHVLVCDITDPEAVDTAVASAAATLGGIDVLVNNAGIGAQGDVADNPDSEWLRVYDVNVLGAVRVTRAALPWLRRSTNPAIVNVCSVVAEVGLPRRALYSATKGALLALTRAMAADHIADRIRVNAVSPGTTDTPWVGRLLDAADDPTAERRALEGRQPLGRLIAAEEVARAIAYLASPASAATTGTVLSVDGGLSSLRLPTILTQ